mgnify:CR=1 FL=1
MKTERTIQPRTKMVISHVLPNPLINITDEKRKKKSFHRNSPFRDGKRNKILVEIKLNP